MSLFKAWDAAIRAGDMDALQHVITTENVNERATDDWSPVERAAHFGQHDMVAWLIAQGANVNSTDSEGRSALYWASRDGYIQCMLALFEAGAVVEKGDFLPSGHSALNWTARCGYESCALLLIDHGARLSQVKQVPDWLRLAVAGREACRAAALLVVAFRRLGHSPVMASNGIDIARMLGKAVWATRLNTVWRPCPPQPAPPQQSQ